MSPTVFGELAAAVRQRLRRPEYTGENRCRLCTVVNLAITVVVGVLLWSVRPVFGASAAVVGTAAIYFRGYLIPGTPTITRRYFPARVLRVFGKTEGREVVHRQDAPIAVTAPELSDGVVNGDSESRLAPSFRRAWDGHLDTTLPEDDARANRAVADVLGVAPETITPVPGAVAFSTDDRLLQWESPAALVADVATATVLADRTTAWTDVGLDRRLELLASVRTLLERCPNCEGTILRSVETPKTCCRTPSPVVLCHCEECDTRLVERPTDDLAGVTVTATPDGGD